MRIDWDLIREILIAVEDLPAGHFTDTAQLAAKGLAGRPPGDAAEPEIAEHVALLNERGLVEVIPTKNAEGDSYIVERLTWSGHEYLGLIRSDTAWGAVKGTARTKGAQLSFEVIVELAKVYVKQKLGLDL